jgi:2-polyprenyl-3-methyl-5-hydroxy-6-metoxy-1,4-benzoquinol methylase
MALESVTTCPLCSGADFELFIHCTDFTVSKEEFSIIKCTTCNFLMTSPRPDSDSIGKYYESEDYISHSTTTKSLLDKLYRKVRSFTLRWKLSLIQRQKPKGKILDYGCGTGEFLNTCRKANWECYGVEPSNSARQKAIELTSLTIVESLTSLHQDKFDTITLWHVLEHVEDLNEKLLALKRILAVDGTIFIAVPNHECFDARKYKSLWAGYDVPRHLWHFSQANMKSLFALHKLHLVDIIPMKQDTFYVSLLSERHRHPTTKIVLNLLRAILTGLKSNLAARKDRNYSSLVYIAKA